MESLNKQIISGLFWRYLERFGNQLIQFVVSMVLARILLPSDFGLIALNTIFLVIATLLTDSGFSSAIIQKKKIDQLDLTTVFYVNIGIATFSYIILFIFAPFIANFYNEPRLIWLLRLQSFLIFFSALNCVQQALLSKRMLFKRSFRISLSETIVNGVTGIYLAYEGFGIWSLVISQLLGKLVSTFVLWFTIKWKPTLEFSYDRFKGMFAFSSRFLSVSLLTAIYDNISAVFIGKFYNTTLLGYYNRGYTIPAMVINNVANTIGQVMLPALSSCQDKKDEVINISRKILVCGSFLVFFFLGMIIATADNLILVLYSITWKESVPFLQIVCLGFFLYPLNQINQVIINSVGRSDLHLKYDIIKKMISVFFLIIGIFFNIYTLVLLISISYIISALISTIPTGKIVGYTFKMQIYDILPQFLIITFMSIITYVLGVFLNEYIQPFGILLIQCIVGTIGIIGLSYLFKISGFILLIKLLKK